MLVSNCVGGNPTNSAAYSILLRGYPLTAKARPNMDSGRVLRGEDWGNITIANGEPQPDPYAFIVTMCEEDYVYRAAHRAQYELVRVQLEGEDDQFIEKFDPSKEDELTRMREWSVCYPLYMRDALTHVNRCKCDLCDCPYEMDRKELNTAMRNLREARDEYVVVEGRVTALKQALVTAQQYEEEDLDLPLAQRLKMNVDERRRRDDEKAKIEQYQCQLTTAEVTMADTDARMESLRVEARRVKSEHDAYKQKHWPIYADGKCVDAASDICQACACNPKIASKYEYYIKKSYRISQGIADRWL